LVTVWTAVAKSQVPRQDGPSCDSLLFASTMLSRSQEGRPDEPHEQRLAPSASGG
jgi:hypothetical protein